MNAVKNGYDIPEYKQKQIARKLATNQITGICKMSEEDYNARVWEIGVEILDSYFAKYDEDTIAMDYKQSLLTDKRVKYWNWVREVVVTEDYVFWNKTRPHYEDWINHMGITKANEKFALCVSIHTAQMKRCKDVHQRLLGHIMINEKTILR